MALWGWLLCCVLTTFMVCAKDKVYDCFPFFNELELLEIRLAELNDCVDYFVLVELVETQRGRIKPLYFQNNKKQFKKYLHKIIHIKIEDRHPEMGMWEREHFQRNCIRKGLDHCKDGDLILISDLDEIPRPKIVLELKKLLHKDHNKRKSKYGDALAYAVEQDLFYFHLNRRSRDNTWHGTVGTLFADLKRKTPQYFRNLRDVLPYLTNGGWHFTWMGGRDRVKQKLSSVVEGTDTGLLYSDADIDRWVSEHAPRVIRIDGSFPRYIQENQAYLKSRGFIADVPSS